LQKINLVFFDFPAFKQKFGFIRKEKIHGQEKKEKSEATNTKRKQSNQTEGSSGLA